MATGQATVAENVNILQAICHCGRLASIGIAKIFFDNHCEQYRSLSSLASCEALQEDLIYLL